MSSIVIASVPVHGHVTPLLAVAKHLIERGDRVRFLTGARFTQTVRGSGVEHLPLPVEADFDDREDLHETFPERAGLRGAKAIAFDLEHLFVRPGRAQYDAIMAAHHQEPADALLVDIAFVGGAFLVGGRLGARPPLVVTSVIPLPIASRDTAPYGMGLLPLRGPLGRLRNRLLSTLAARTGCPRTPARPSTCRTTSCCRRPTSSSPTVVTAESRSLSVTVSRSSRAGARRTSLTWPAASSGPASVAD